MIVLVLVMTMSHFLTYRVLGDVAIPRRTTSASLAAAGADQTGGERSGDFGNIVTDLHRQGTCNR